MDDLSPWIRPYNLHRSTFTRKRVLECAAATLKHVTLELGGNDPGIVLPDAEPEKIARSLFDSMFLLSGQGCICLKRSYVHEDIYSKVTEALVALAAAAKFGDGFDPHTMLGPCSGLFALIGRTSYRPPIACDCFSSLSAHSNGCCFLSGTCRSGQQISSLLRRIHVGRDYLVCSVASEIVGSCRANSAGSELRTAEALSERERFLRRSNESRTSGTVTSFNRSRSATVWCAANRQLDGERGIYCEDCDVAQKVPAETTKLGRVLSSATRERRSVVGIERETHGSRILPIRPQLLLRPAALVRRSYRFMEV